MSNAESNTQQVAIEDHGTPEATPEEQAEAYYWLTITDFVKLMVQYGAERVMGDFTRVAERVHSEQARNHPIIRV